MTRLVGYLKQYMLKDMIEMYKNGNKEPLICDTRCDGTFVAITGATSGIGLETARSYAAKGARLLLINRNEAKSKALCERLKREWNSEVDYLIADFSNLSEVKSVAQKILASNDLPDIFIHNVGVFHTQYSQTSDGIESVFQINHLAAFTISYMLREAYKSRGKGRLIYVNSEGHRFALSGVHIDDLKWKKHKYSGLRSYGAARTAQLLMLLDLKDYFEDSGITVAAMHPGNVATQIGDDNDEKYIKYKARKITPHARSPKISGQSLYYLGISEEVNQKSGLYYSLTFEEKPAPHALDKDAIEEVIEASRNLVGL